METQKQPLENIYPAAALSELARLQNQDTYLNRHMLLRAPSPTQPGLALLPPSFQPSAGSVVLDPGCGPGGWVLEVALACPELRVIGLDRDEKKIEFARSQAIATGIKNAEFVQGDMLRLADFIPPASVDFLHGRFLEWFLKDYAAVVKAWMEVLRPGGVISLTESDGALTNSASYNRILHFSIATLEKTHGKIRASDHYTGLTLHLRKILADLGLHEIEERAHVVNFSAGVPDRDLYVLDNCQAMQSLRPFLLKYGDMSAETYDALVQEAMDDLLHNEQFCAIQYFLTATGIKA